MFEQALVAGATEVAPVSEGCGWRVGRRGRSVWISLGDWKATQQLSGFF